jgi:hypothetical protein
MHALPRPRLCSAVLRLCSPLLGGQAGAAQVITQQVAQRAVGPHGDALCTGIVILGNRLVRARVGHFIMSTNEVRGDRPIDGGLAIT